MKFACRSVVGGWQTEITFPDGVTALVGPSFNNSQHLWAWQERNLGGAAVSEDLLAVARAVALATNEGDDAAQGTHYIDRSGVIRCKGSFLETIEIARRAVAVADRSAQC